MKSTRKKVESALEKYRYYLLSILEYKLPKITTTHTFLPKGTSESSYSGIEKAVIEKVDYERERIEYITMIQKAVNRLNSKERELIIRRYMLDEDEDTFDYELYNDMVVMNLIITK